MKLAVNTGLCRDNPHTAEVVALFSTTVSSAFAGANLWIILPCRDDCHTQVSEGTVWEIDRCCYCS